MSSLFLYLTFNPVLFEWLRRANCHRSLSIIFWVREQIFNCQVSACNKRTPYHWSKEKWLRGWVLWTTYTEWSLDGLGLLAEGDGDRDSHATGCSHPSTALAGHTRTALWRMVWTWQEDPGISRGCIFKYVLLCCLDPLLSLREYKHGKKMFRSLLSVGGGHDSGRRE